MMFRKIVVTVSKLILCTFAFYFGFLLGAVLAGVAGIAMPDLPAGADAATIQKALQLASLLVAVCLAFLSPRLSVNFFLRWLSLAALVWLAYGVNTYLEASIFTAYGVASSINVITSLGAGLFSGAAAAWVFPPVVKPAPFLSIAVPFFQQFGKTGWLWRILAAIAAFPLAYYFFGMLISPIVLPYYQQQGGNLMIPALGTLLPVLFLRSIFFLVSSFMILVTWGKTRLSLWLSLSLAMFMLVGGIGMLLGSFLPNILRVVHSFEILADSLTYVGALVLLFRSARVEPQVQPGKVGWRAAG